MSKTFTYDICVPSERGAGIRGFTDTVSITVESGDPGGDETGEDSFQEFMRQALSEWYDGGKVTHTPYHQVKVKGKDTSGNRQKGKMKNQNYRIWE